MNPDTLFKNAISKYNTWYKFIDKNQYNEEAIELFQKAKNIYMINKNYNKVFECYEWIIKCSLETKDNLFDDINRVYEEYATILLQKEYNITRALELYNLAINGYTYGGKINNIISIKEKLAEYYKKQLEYKEAIKLYLDIKELIIDQKYKYDKVTKELYELYIMTNDYENAYTVANEMLIKCNDNNLTKYNLNNYMFDATMCYIIIDKETAHNKFDTYCESYPSFINSKQYRLLLTILEAINSNDIELFENSVRNYDSISTLSNIHIKLLSNIKQKIGDNDTDSLL